MRCLECAAAACEHADAKSAEPNANRSSLGRLILTRWSYVEEMKHIGRITHAY